MQYVRAFLTGQHRAKGIEPDHSSIGCAYGVIRVRRMGHGLLRPSEQSAQGFRDNVCMRRGTIEKRRQQSGPLTYVYQGSGKSRPIFGFSAYLDLGAEAKRGRRPGVVGNGVLVGEGECGS